jgi:acetolactate decarboxylase
LGRAAVRWLLAALVVATVAVGTAAAAPARGVLYQVSIIDALMAGLYDGQTTVAELRRHGDFGLGTFTGLDGEMVALDGRFYQVTADSVAHPVPGTQTTPFAAVTFFRRDVSVTIESGPDLAGLQAALDLAVASTNVPWAVRVDGAFRSVRARSVPRQKPPYPKLTDVVATQPTFEFRDVSGTLVGFRCPYFMQSVNVPGYHLHFLTADRSRGGHVLDCTISSATASAHATPELHVALPRDVAFVTANLKPPPVTDLEKVEKGH